MLQVVTAGGAVQPFRPALPCDSSCTPLDPAGGTQDVQMRTHCVDVKVGGLSEVFDAQGRFGLRHEGRDRLPAGVLRGLRLGRWLSRARVRPMLSAATFIPTFIA